MYIIRKDECSTVRKFLQPNFLSSYSFGYWRFHCISVCRRMYARKLDLSSRKLSEAYCLYC